ncbi:hypothetical protein GGI12_005048, partial [Dipsacomyces acuminosporus]
MALRSSIYNELSGQIANNSTKVAVHKESIVALLGHLQRDVSSTDTPRNTLLSAIKCLACILHVDNACKDIAPEKLSEILLAMCRRVEKDFKTDKGICQAAVWCVGMLRINAKALQLALSGLVSMSVRVLNQFESSSTITY